MIKTRPAGSAGARAGLRPGDRLLAVDGQPIANSSAFRSIVGAAANREISIEVERQGERLRIVAAVPLGVGKGGPVGRLGIQLQESAPLRPPGLGETPPPGPAAAPLICA